LKKDELFIEIPESMIFTFDKVQKHLPDIFKNKAFLECPLLDDLSQSHVRLAVALVIEKLNPESKWKPYLDLLPEKFRTVLYYTTKEMEELRGTMALSPAIKQVKFIATQYAFLYKYFVVAMENDPAANILRDSFTYEFYRWATATVMTRQNIIPREGDKKESVLIPLWDMSNHVNGVVNTQFNEETHQIESFCLNDFSIGSQVTMAYGNRCNQDFLIHNGFVNVDNDNKDLFIKLSISKSDELYEGRMNLLEKLDLEPVGNFQVSPFLSSSLLGFVRVFNMNREMLDTWLKADNPKELYRSDLKLDESFNKKVTQFLLMRIKLLIRAFPTTLEEDRNLLDAPNISKTKKMLIQYRMLEKEILHQVELKLSA
jgi:protein-histidine N-methyltransferase